MEKTIVLVCLVAICGLTAGCAVAPRDDACSRQSAKIIANPGTLRINHECIQANPGQLIRLELVGGKPIGTARTRPDPEKNPNANWLDRSNTDEREIIIEVPSVRPVDPREGADSCEEEVCTFKYEIVVDGVGTLDPRVRVNF